MVDLVALSKHMSYVLRHDPASIGVVLDAAGWVNFEEFVAAMGSHVPAFGESDIRNVVATSDKQRFELVNGRIRAAQGHSIEVDLGLRPQAPPDVLWHGTVARFAPSILEHGLLAGSRTHVHLTESQEAAMVVGERRGKPQLVRVEARAMADAGHRFFCTSNGVWLTESVPSAYLRWEDSSDN